MITHTYVYICNNNNSEDQLLPISEEYNVHVLEGVVNNGEVLGPGEPGWDAVGQVATEQLREEREDGRDGDANLEVVTHRADQQPHTLYKGTKYY